MKKYPEYLPGDEVYTEKPNWKSISPNKPYRVLSCYAPKDLDKDTNVRVIEIITNLGYISRYATNRFKKTDTQLRDDKIKEIFNTM